MPDHGKRGAFIVIEGLDRSGKSTQVAALADRLQRAGFAVKTMKFPDRSTAIGSMIDTYLRSKSELDDRAIHLLFSANRWELASVIETTLRAGTIIICDRYAFSGVAFSTAKNNLSYEWCRAPDVGLPAPDMTVFLDVSPEKAKMRGNYGEERYEQEDMQKRVRVIFDRIGAEMRVETSWATVNADLDKDVVAEVLWKTIEPFTHGVVGPITTLWNNSV